MANIGLANASYYAGTSITRFNNQVETSVEKVASNKANVSNGDKTALANMNSNFKLEIAATNAAVKSMSIAQAYLSTAISTLDNASAILTKIHEIAVLSANGSNSDADNEALNTESESLIDAFHKSMTVAQFKGKQVFTDEPGTLSLAAGGQASQIQFGVGKVDYDVLYDYENPGLTSLSSGVKYEIRRELNDLEKAAILSRTTDLTAEQLVKGFQFTTDDVPTENIGDGTLNVNPNGTNIHTYNQGSGVQQFDAAASAAGITADFKDGFLEFEITENYELSDNLSVESTGNIRVTDGVVFFTDNTLLDENGVLDPQEIEIGVVDEVKNGQNGTTLRINLHHDATVPGTSNLLNGDFSKTDEEILSYSKNVDYENREEARTGVLGNLYDAAIINPVPGDMYTISNNILAPTYENIELAGGSGTGARVSIKTAIVDGNETISEIQYLDKGKNYQATDTLTVPDGVGGIAGSQIKVDNVTAETVVLTVADFDTTYKNSVHPDNTLPGTPYDFDVNGDPNGFPKLTYGPGDIVLNNRRTGQGENQGWETYVVTEVDTRTYSGERTLQDPVFQNYTANTQTVPENWTRYENRVDFGIPFTIKQYPTNLNGPNALQAGELTGNVNVETPAPTVDTSGRTEFVVPTPTDAQMAQVAAGTANDNGTKAATRSNPSVSVDGGKLKLDTGNFDFAAQDAFGVLHGPAAVSDEFKSKEGQFLKLDYVANEDGDDYHVVGYIYQVDRKDDGTGTGAAISDPIIAFNSTDRTGSGRASVEVPNDGYYRFVFIVGTYDRTGGLEAGAFMTIDNIVAEDPYTIGTGAISDLLKALHFENNATSANPNKTLVAKATTADGATMLKDDALIEMANFSDTLETNGPYMLAPTLDFTTKPSDGGSNSANVLTRKIETVQDRINLARTQAASQFSAVQEAIDSTTDLRSQFALASGTLSDLNFSVETVNLTRRQMQQDVASSVLMQANEAQTGLVSLVDGSYKGYLNSQFSYLK